MLYRFAKKPSLTAETVTGDEERLFFVYAACRIATTNTQLEQVTDYKTVVSAKTFRR
jgi:hypothetical protein